MSAISPESLAWLDEHGAAAWMREAGAATYGPDLAIWPGRALDAHKLIQIEQARLDAARDEATR